MASEQFSLCWDNFHKNMSSGMHSLLESEDLVDVTLAVEGRYLKAHKMVLSVCSPYFRELFQMNPCKHPIVFMKDVNYTVMSDLLTFMYQGEVQVNQEQLAVFIKTAEALQIKGLTNDGNNEALEVSDDQSEEPASTKASPPPHLPPQSEITPRSTPKTKKMPAHYPASKRQKISSPTRDKGSPIIEKTETVISCGIKMDQLPQQTAEQLIHFKMEPYEAEQSDHTQMENFEENPDDNLADDGVDEGPIDETEYNTMLKGEVEPQASTSGDALGETQGDRKISHMIANVAKLKKKRKYHRIVHNGFLYNISTTRTSDKRYYRCANKKNSGCLATAVLGKNASLDNLTILRPHNHPRDKTMEMKYNFEMELTKAVKNSNASIKNIYDALAEIQPEAARIVPYDQNLYNRLKRRRISSNDMFGEDNA